MDAVAGVGGKLAGRLGTGTTHTGGCLACLGAGGVGKSADRVLDCRKIVLQLAKFGCQIRAGSGRGPANVVLGSLQFFDQALRERSNVAVIAVIRTHGLPLYRYTFAVFGLSAFAFCQFSKISRWTIGSERIAADRARPAGMVLSPRNIGEVLEITGRTAKIQVMCL
jgi:hypothetical protein